MRKIPKNYSFTIYAVWRFYRKEGVLSLWPDSFFATKKLARRRINKSKEYHIINLRVEKFGDTDLQVTEGPYKNTLLGIDKVQGLEIQQ